MLVLVVLVIAFVVVVYRTLQPPAPLALPERGAVLHDVTVIEPGRERIDHRRLVVTGDKITAIQPALPGGDNPFSGMYVLPGLADLHVHFPSSALPGQTDLFAFLYLYHGITAARDAGDVDGTASDPARSGIAEGRFPGPRLFSCGLFLDGEPPLWKNSIVARNPEEGRRAVKTVADRGYDCVKAYNQLDAETLAAIREAAHERGLKVIGHVPWRVSYEEAQLDDAQHMIGIQPPPADPATAKFPFLLAEWEQLDDKRINRLIADSKHLKIAMTPTLVTLDRLIASEDYASMLREPDAQMVPAFYRNVVWNPTGGTNVAGQMKAEDFAMVRRVLEIEKRTVKRMYDGGVAVHTGSDSLAAFVVPGASLHRELRLYVDAGFTPEEALGISMHDSAEYLGVPNLGMLQAGAPAELLIFREDPTQNLDALATLAGVVRDGRLYTREVLDAQFDRYHAHFDAPLFNAIVTPMVRWALAKTREH
jgi:imidazolonepropionase-like amidohydrolase